MNNNTKIISGILLLILSSLVLISMVSFMFSWKEDLSAMAVIFNDGIEIKNISFSSELSRNSLNENNLSFKLGADF